MGRGPGVRAVGPRAIQIDFRYKGVRCRERLTLEPTKANLRYAANLKARIEHEIATGTFDYERHFPGRHKAHVLSDRKRTDLLVDYAERFCDSLDGTVEPETLADYREYVAVIGATEFGRRPLGQLTRAQVREWVQAQKVSRKRLNNLLIPLRGALRQAHEDGVIQANPLAGFKLGRRVEAAKEIVDPLTPEELEALGQQRHGALWTFWAFTGLRTSELIALRWADVAGDSTHLRVWRAIRQGREKRTKSESGVRVVRLLDPARLRLRVPRGADGEPVWTGANGRPFHGDKPIRLLFHADCVAAGIRRRRGPYCLRHTFASLALSAGEPLGWVSAQMGHKDPWMTLRVYAKWVPSVFPDAGDRMVKAVTLRQDEGKGLKNV